MPRARTIYSFSPVLLSCARRLYKGNEEPSLLSQMVLFVHLRLHYPENDVMFDSSCLFSEYRHSTEVAMAAIEESGSPFTFAVMKILRSNNAAYVTFTKAMYLTEHSHPKISVLIITVAAKLEKRGCIRSSLIFLVTSVLCGGISVFVMELQTIYRPPV